MILAFIIHGKHLSFHPKGRTIVLFPIDFPISDFPFALLKPQLLGTANHADVARPGLGVKLMTALVEVIIHKGSQCLGSDAMAPCITFANVNANSTICSLTFLDFPHTLIVFVDEIGTDPSDMSSIPLNFKLPANSVFRGISI